MGNSKSVQTFIIIIYSELPPGLFPVGNASQTVIADGSLSVPLTKLLKIWRCLNLKKQINHIDINQLLKSA